MVRIWLFLVMVLFCSSCLHHQMEMGKKIDSGKAEQIIDGKTTEAEAIALLGEPQRVHTTGKGIRLLTYSYHQSQMYSAPYTGRAKGDISSQMLTLWVKNGIVIRKSASASNLPTGIQAEQTLTIPDKFK